MFNWLDEAQPHYEGTSQSFTVLNINYIFKNTFTATCGLASDQMSWCCGQAKLTHKTGHQSRLEAGPENLHFYTFSSPACSVNPFTCFDLAYLNILPQLGLITVVREMPCIDHLKPIRIMLGGMKTRRILTGQPAEIHTYFCKIHTVLVTLIH